jgi:hypothetical protein
LYVRTYQRLQLVFFSVSGAEDGAHVLMNENRKMRHVEIIPEIEGGGDKGE